ncbi:hypothetical protein MPNT_40070 [Candidatus Methylacidithermus pantelleriae]|uniref:Uncharacterized protein n=1 Tax=Candidatus Methylacidithermus pantelleriae TaxID=2744239 RepID=A0A8J2BM27_9BACT|nr:hypothetical protein MPNT_40070 [Candidatus Methylacidithermus pantelleriae]
MPRRPDRFRCLLKVLAAISGRLENAQARVGRGPRTSPWLKPEACAAPFSVPGRLVRMPKVAGESWDTYALVLKAPRESPAASVLSRKIHGS